MLFDQPDKTIVHFDLDTFFVSVERRINSALEGKPLLIGGTSERGVVGSCSYEARAFGVQNGMAMKEARRLCPEAIIVRGDAGKYSKASGEVTQIIKESVPLMEKASVDEFYLDMTGMDQIFGIQKYTKELRQRIIHETHLPISMGISGNKSVSKIATSESKPSGELTILKGTEKGFLAPLSVRKLPLVGNETYQVLQELGIRTIHTLQQMPVQAMENVLGKNGETIWLRAQGIDNTPLKPYYERESLSLERTFGQDTMDLVRLHNTLTAMTEGLAYQLRAGNKLTACVTVKVRYADMQVYSRQSRIPYTNCDHTLLRIVKEIFAKLYTRRQLIRLIGVSCSHLVGGGHQMNMLEDSVELIQLYQQMDRLRKKYHDSRIIKRACTMDQRNLDVWDPWNGEPPVPGGHRTA